MVTIWKRVFLSLSAGTADTQNDANAKPKTKGIADENDVKKNKSNDWAGSTDYFREIKGMLSIGLFKHSSLTKKSFQRKY